MSEHHPVMPDLHSQHTFVFSQSQISPDMCLYIPDAPSFHILTNLQDSQTNTWQRLLLAAFHILTNLQDSQTEGKDHTENQTFHILTNLQDSQTNNLYAAASLSFHILTNLQDSQTISHMYGV